MKDQNQNISSGQEATPEELNTTSAKDLFLTGMSHEIRTPLSDILGMTTLAKRSTSLTEIRSYLNKIEISSNKLLTLINDFLDISRMEVGKLQLESLPFDLESVLEHGINTMREEIEGKRLILFKKLSQPLSRYLIGDRFRFFQIFANLLGNAVKFTPDGGRITVTVQNDTQDECHSVLQVAISDTGVGMSEEAIARLFRFFEQGDSNIAQINGSGLGLSICRKLLARMGGELHVSSTLSQGSTFAFELPVSWGEKISATRPIQPAVRPGTEDDENYDWRGKCFLLAEDDEMNQEILEHMFWDTGVRLINAHNGQEALDFYLENPQRCQLILMDVQMPVMDGLVAAQKIRASGKPGCDSIPIIACTAHTFPEQLHQFLASGMNGYILKPYNFQEMMLTLNSYL
ncbi:MAG: response regulator [Clostridium sp.]|jgi:CheY-like chemotaxis protein/nitrogen-specific signal transduction histidine kinase|nr:response regulator [Clostridium sp.]